MKKIGIDLDYTITEMPWFFAPLTAALKLAGHEIHIVTYRDREDRAETEAELQELKIQYDQLHLPEDDALPAAWKADVCTRLGLDLMIDDAPEVLAALPAGIKRLWVCDPEVFDLDVCIKAMQTRQVARESAASLKS